MNWNSVFFTIYELVISLVFGLFTIFIVIKFLNVTFLRSRRGNALLQANTAVGVFAGAMIFCVLVLVMGSILPSVDALRTMVLGQQAFSVSVLLLSLGYFLVFYSVALVISIAVIYMTTLVYMMATIHIDEMSEIRRNNVAVAVLVSAVLLGMTLFIRPAVQRFISSLVDYETLERIDWEAPAEIEGGEEVIIDRQKKNMPE